jgi:hypothetical protein
MYCPRCGQQAFDEVRFCSRCGFRLDGVTALLDHEGAAAVYAAEPRATAVSPRQKGIRLGVKLIFLSIVVLPLIIAMAVLTDSPAPLIVPFTVFLGGLTRLLYSVIFEDEWSPVKQVPQRLQPRVAQHLPPPPASITGPRPVNTADMLKAPSVTENTTNLLNEPAECC